MTTLVTVRKRRMADSTNSLDVMATISDTRNTHGQTPLMIRPHYSLFIPEVLLDVLERLSPKELVRAALVCKAWLGLAVDTKWRTTDILLSRFLGKLAEIRKSDRGRTVVSEARSTVPKAFVPDQKMPAPLSKARPQDYHHKRYLEAFSGTICGSDHKAHCGHRDRRDFAQADRYTTRQVRRALLQ